jgi:hypothetical protein
LTDHNLPVEYVVESHPFARYRSEGEWADGVRPAHIVETIEDVAWAIANLDRERPQLACGFCGDRYLHQSATPDKALNWFRTHACEAEGVPIDQWAAAS